MTSGRLSLRTLRTRTSIQGVVRASKCRRRPYPSRTLAHMPKAQTRPQCLHMATAGSVRVRLSVAHT